jgi:hypothetical protein
MPTACAPPVSACAALACEDGFLSVFGRGRGRGATRPDAAPSCYDSLEDGDLRICMILDPANMAAWEDALTDRSALDRLSSLDLRFLGLSAQRGANQREGVAVGASSGQPGEPERWRRAATHLEAAHKAREAREESVLAGAGGRRLGMLSVRGNVALTQLLDSLVGLSPPEATRALRAGLLELDETYSELTDTEVREATMEHLERLGVMLDGEDVWPLALTGMGL